MANSGFGSLLIDAENAFNEMNRYLMLWQVRHRWGRGSRFAFNRYRHHSIIYVRDRPGDAPHIILGKEGVNQGCVFGSVCYGIGLMPIAERMREEVPEALQPLFADDITAAGQAGHNAACLAFLKVHGPVYGYYPEPSKSIYVCKGEDEAVARMALVARGLTGVTFKRGHRYLGSYVGCRELKEEYVRDKVSVWVGAIKTLTKLAPKYPQAVYCGYTLCLQNEWQFLCRTTPDIAALLEPVERALRKELLPAFLGVDECDVSNSFRELLALAIKRGGMGIRNPMATAEEFYDTSVSCTSYLVETLIKREPFDGMRHRGHIADAVEHARKVKALAENNFLEKRGRGKPAEKRRWRKAERGTGSFLSAIPNKLNGTCLSAEQWRDGVRILFNLEPLDMPQHCDGCGAKMTVDHAASCKKGGLVHIRHDDLGSEIRHLASCAFSHSRVSREPYINERVGRLCREIAAAEEAQISQTTTPPATQLQQQQPQQQQQRQPRQSQQQRGQGQQQEQSTLDSIDGKRGDVGIYGFWSPGRQAIFDVRVTDTDARSHRHKGLDKVLAGQEKEKKDKYLRRCHELRKDFTPLVYSVDGMAGREALIVEKRLASILANKWHRRYSEMVPYVRMRIRMSLVRSMSLLIRGARDREPARPFGNPGSELYERQTWGEEW